MATVAEQLVGRAEEVGAVEHALTGLGAPRPATLVVLGEPGIGKTRMLAELAERSDALGQIVLSGSASELESDLPFWVFVDALDEYVAGLDPRRLQSLEDDVRAELGRVLPVDVRVRRAGRCSDPGRALPRRIAPCASCSSALRPRSRSCSFSTTCTGPTQPRSSCSAPCCAGHRPHRSCSRSARGRGSCRSGWRRARARAIAAARSSRLELGAPRARRRRPCSWASSVDAALADSDLRGERRQPVLPRAARSGSARDRRAPRRPPRGLDLGGIEVPRGGGRRAHRGARAALEADPRAARRRRGGRRPLRARAGGSRGGSRRAVGQCRLSTSCSPATSCGRPTCPRRFRFRHPLVRTDGLRDRARWLAARRARALRRGARGARRVRRRRAPITWSMRRSQGDSAGASQCCGTPGWPSTLRAPASAARWFGAALRLLPGQRADRGARRAPDGTRRGPCAPPASSSSPRGPASRRIGLVPGDAVALRVRLTVACRQYRAPARTPSGTRTRGSSRRSRGAPRPERRPRPSRSWSSSRSTGCSAPSTSR